MSATLLNIFEQYQKARVQFVQAVAEAATRPQNIDTMQNAGVMQLLRPLLLDNVRITTTKRSYFVYRWHMSRNMATYVSH